MSEPLPENVCKALEYVKKKYGLPPQVIIEYSNKLVQVPILENITFKSVQIPPNILLIAIEEPKE